MLNFYLIILNIQGSHICFSNLLVTISVRFTYVIQENKFIDWQQFNAQHQQILDSINNELVADESQNAQDDEEEFYPKIKSLPFGSLQDCIE